MDLPAERLCPLGFGNRTRLEQRCDTLYGIGAYPCKALGSLVSKSSSFAHSGAIVIRPCCL
jgi:hypothetical protein